MVKAEKKSPPKITYSLPFTVWILFTAGIWLFSFYVIQTQLIYHGYGRISKWSPFYTGWAFFTECASTAGGINQYIASFLSQWYYYNAAGATIITVFALLLTILTDRLILSTNLKFFRILSVVPAASLLLVHCRYEHHLAAFLALIINLFLILLYTTVKSSNNIFRSILLLFITLISYYISGDTAFIFILSAGLFELFIRGDKRLGIICIATAAVTYYIMYRLFNHALAASHLLVPAWFLIAGFLNIIKISKRAPSKNPESPKTQLRFIAAALPLLYLAIILSAGLIAQDKQKKHVLKISDYAEKGMWQQIIDYANHTDVKYSLYTNHDIDLALFHRGLLGSNMFSYRQQIPALLLASTGSEALSRRVLVLVKRTEIFMEFGHLGTAEKAALEMLEMTQVPFARNQLAYISLAKGQTETAKMFLNSLSKDVIYAPQARTLLAEIDADPELKTNSRVQYLRSVASDVDNPVFAFDADGFFVQLLEKNPQNRIALEYMTAFNLLTGQLKKVVDNLWRFKQAGYERLPVYCNEALAIYIGSGNKLPADIPYQPDPATMYKVKMFNQLYKRSGGATNKQKAAYALFSDYGQTYIYYFVFLLPR